MTAATDRLRSEKIHFRAVDLDETKIFYREVGDPGLPNLLLLHGFPTSSHMFRELMPLLSGRFHIVAPDLPGFGFTEVFDQPGFKYTFDNLAGVVEAFTEAIGLERYALYLFDYGAPVGFRLAIAHPERVMAIISQNGNAYEEGLSANWDIMQKYWREPNAANRKAARALLTAEATKQQYLHGVVDESLVAPETYTLDFALMERPGNEDIQLDLILDYANNVALYPRFHEYFAKEHPPLLAVWGRNDPFFLPAGAEAFRRDNPNAEAHFYETGHFALETHADEIAVAIGAFLRKVEPADASIGFHEPGEASFTEILPESIVWKPFPAFPASVRLAILVGDPGLPSPYLIRVKVPAGVKLLPHSHPEDRIYTVISGVFYIGLGEEYDSSKLKAYPPGSVIVLPGDTAHFHGAESGEYVTQVSAIGPLGLEYVDPENDPRKT